MENFNYREFNSTTPSFLGYINQGKIFNTYNQQIGVSMEEYNRVLGVAKDYKKVLEDRGIIEKEKTPEEMNKELHLTISKQAEIMAKMTETIQAINEKVTLLEKRNGQDKDNGNCEQVSESRKDK